MNKNKYKKNADIYFVFKNNRHSMAYFCIPIFYTYFKMSFHHPAAWLSIKNQGEKKSQNSNSNSTSSSNSSSNSNSNSDSNSNSK